MSWNQAGSNESTGMGSLVGNLRSRQSPFADVQPSRPLQSPPELVQMQQQMRMAALQQQQVAAQHFGLPSLGGMPVMPFNACPFRHVLFH